MFTARAVAVEEYNHMFLVAVFDDPSEPQHHFEIQRGKTLDEREAELGMDRLYFEFDDQLYGFYGGVSKVELSRYELCISIDGEVARKNSLSTLAHIRLSIDHEEWSELRNGLESILDQHVAFVVLET